MSDCLFDKTAKLIDVDDRMFFSKALETAISLVEKANENGFELTSKELKESTPIVHCSSLSPKQNGDEIVTRTEVHSERARRKFLMADMDFEAGQEMISEMVWEKAKSLCESLSTPIMTYPTASWPAKPRWRLVMLSKRGLNKDAYWKAMTWLYAQLQIEPTDASDLNMSMNRNLPAFSNISQATAPFTYSTFDNEELMPLDSKLWSDVKLPKKRKLKSYDVDEYMNDSVDFEKLLDGCVELGKSPLCSSYDTYWRVSMSFAAAVMKGLLSRVQADECVRSLASGTTDAWKKAQWEVGNSEMLSRHLYELTEKGEAAISACRPIQTYYELKPAFTTTVVEEDKENDQ